MPPIQLPVLPADIESAARRIEPYIRRTPLLDVDGVTCKLELLQVTGSFKARGAFSLLTATDATEVVAASGGNFGVAVAHAAHRLGKRATVFVPDSSPRAKIARLDDLGAEVHVIPGLYHEALDASRTRAAETGALFAHAFDLPEVVAGQGTCGRELAAQIDNLDTVIVAVGGGGLVAGIAAWFGGSVKVVAVETTGTPTLHSAFAAGRPVDVELTGHAVSSLGARRLGTIPWLIAQRHVQASLLVPDEEVRAAQRALWAKARLVAEAGGATAYAAILSGAYVPAPDERVVVVVCGANTDPNEVLT